MLTSKGMAGVPGASFVVVLATLGSMGLPLEGIAIIAGIDRILDMIRSSVNVLGNALRPLLCRSGKANSIMRKQNNM